MMTSSISKMIGYDNGIVNILHALQSTWYGTQWSGNGITYDAIDWLDTNEISKPSEVEIDAEIVILQAEYDAQQYARDRQSEYPSIQDQLDYIYHNSITKWKSDMIKPVKDAHPKP